MGFDVEDLRAHIAKHGRVVRVVIASVKGSSPREVGAAMLIWPEGQSGTIGGGALEFAAVEAARQMTQGSHLSHHPLGPELGQCCGGTVTLLSEVYTHDQLVGLDSELIARPATSDTQMPMSVKRVMAQARGQGVPPESQFLDGWMIEPVHLPARPVWIWGAGHVGRALVDVLAPLPDLTLHWVDVHAQRFPHDIPDGVTAIPAARPEELVRHAPAAAEHFILTYSHALDLELCHQLLLHGFARAGLIGSATKWARFRSRLRALGHSAEQIARITCPIGDPSLGKHPQAIAVGVAATLLHNSQAGHNKKDMRA